jgi:hypothetical protein
VLSPQSKGDSLRNERRFIGKVKAMLKNSQLIAHRSQLTAHNRQKAMARYIAP